IASSTPSFCTSTISSASEAMRSGEMPYSWSPISASPESFSTTRPKAGTGSPSGATLFSGLTFIAASLCQGVALERNDLEPLLGEGLRDGLARVEDPRLLGEHVLGEEALLQHPLDDLRLHVGRLALD